MKQFLSVIYVAIIVALCINYHNVHSLKGELKQLEQTLTENIRPQTHEVVSFDEYQVITRQDEFDQVTRMLERKVNESSKSVAILTKFAEDHRGTPLERQSFEALEYARSEMYRYQALYNSFYNYRSNFSENQLNSVTYREYELVYDVPNSYGSYDRHTYRGRFDSWGKLVAIQSESGAEWVTLPNHRYHSTPPLYDEV